MMFEEILEDLPEVAPERYAPTQALLEIRTAQGPELLALYRDWRKREPDLAAALVYAGERAWNRLCTQLARFIDAGAANLPGRGWRLRRGSPRVGAVLAADDRARPRRLRGRRRVCVPHRNRTKFIQ
jgi:hypothetical protein